MGEEENLGTLKQVEETSLQVLAVSRPADAPVQAVASNRLSGETETGAAGLAESISAVATLASALAIRGKHRAGAHST